MIADLHTLPYSRKGSWMVLSELEDNWNGCGNKAGYLLWASMVRKDGLARCGKTELVRDTAARFADMVSMSGFAENFDAMTGEGLRDRSYTWTASAFLTMCHEYLLS